MEEIKVYEDSTNKNENEKIGGIGIVCAGVGVACIGVGTACIGGGGLLCGILCP